MSRKNSSIPKLTGEEVSRFWAKVTRDDPDGNGCWLWQGAKGEQGYGRFKLQGQTYLAHRVAFSLHFGDSPDYQICHECDNPQCVNPKHLYDKTGFENTEEARERGRLHIAEKPARPYAEFPLFPHNSGQWAKKIRGRLVYFGVWSDPDAALKKYFAEKEALHAGKKPREDAEGYTVKMLCNDFLNAKQALVKSGELTQRSWQNYKEAAELTLTKFGKGRLVANLDPDDFAELRTVMVNKGWSAVTLGSVVQRVRVLFKFAFDNGSIDRPVRYGQNFKTPSRKTVRIDRAKKGPKLFSADQVRMLIDGATVPCGDEERHVVPGPAMRAMVLLGINCGFGNADCGRLTKANVNLSAGVIDYPRPKTGIPRRCALWPETVEAIRAALAARPEPKDYAHADLIFITKYGQPWAKDTADQTQSKEFAKLLRALGLNTRGGLGFYTLRHTFRTIADEAKDQPAADFIMGHESPHMSSVYRETISDERLKAVSDHVRKWVYGEAT